MSSNDPITAQGIALLAQKRYPEAAAEFERVTQADPNNAAAWGYLGGARNALHKNAEALEALDRAPSLSPSAVWMWVEKARAARARPRS